MFKSFLLSCDQSGILNRGKCPGGHMTLHPFHLIMASIRLPLDERLCPFCNTEIEDEQLSLQYVRCIQTLEMNCTRKSENLHNNLIVFHIPKKNVLHVVSWKLRNVQQNPTLSFNLSKNTHTHKNRMRLVNFLLNDFAECLQKFPCICTVNGAIIAM